MNLPPFITPDKVADLKGAADIIVEADALTTYLGFCEPGTLLTSAPKWAVCKIVQNGAAYPIETRCLWADGNFVFNQVFDNYAALTYKFHNF